MSPMLTEYELFRSLVMLLVAGSLAGTIAGMLLLARPEWLLKAGGVLNRWISTRQMSADLSRGINVDRWFYRYGWLGALLLPAAVYIDVTFMLRLDRSMLLSAVGRLQLVPAVWQDTVTDVFVLLMLAGAQLALILSLFLLFRPSMLKEIEAGANHRISMRLSLRPLEAQRNGVEKWIFGNMVMSGLMLLLGSLYVLLMLGGWLVGWW